MKEFTGSWVALIVWLVLFFPIGIIYYFCNYEKVE